MDEKREDAADVRLLTQMRRRRLKFRKFEEFLAEENRKLQAKRKLKAESKTSRISKSRP